MDSAAALHTIHGEMSKLTTMMVFMHENFARLSPHEVAGVQDLSQNAQSRSFSTPPPLTNNKLSLIPEAHTPTPTSQTGKAPQIPPNFGQLTPQQLPHPVFPPNSVSQTFTVTAPITSSVPSSSAQPTNHNLSQFTNPSSHPPTIPAIHHSITLPIIQPV
jgi:hypothetical protein